MNSKILHAALFMLNPEGGWGLPILLWGPPGTGKTAFVGGASKRYSMAYERLSPAEKGEGGFGVVPIPQSDGFLHFPAPDWSAHFEGKSGLIFVDEINCFVAGTPVTIIRDGNTELVPIEAIRADDCVLSVDIATGRTRANRVEATRSRRARFLTRIELEDGRTIETTPEHPFYTAGGWVNAGQLERGDGLRTLPDLSGLVAGHYGYAHQDSRDVLEEVSSRVSLHDNSRICTSDGTSEESCGSSTQATANGSCTCGSSEGTREALGQTAREPVSQGIGCDPGTFPCDVQGAVLPRAASSYGSARRPRSSAAISRAYSSRPCASPSVLAIPSRSSLRLSTGASSLEKPQDARDRQRSRVEGGDRRANTSSISSYSSDAERTHADQIHQEAQAPAQVRGRRRISGAPARELFAVLAESGLHRDGRIEASSSSRFVRELSDARGDSGLRGRRMDDPSNQLPRTRRSDMAAAQAETVSSWVLIQKIETVLANEEVFDLTVARDHNFFAHDVLVHNCAPPALQAPLLGLVQLRTLGSHKFGPRTRVIAAANEVSDAAGGWDLAPALANRFGHFDWSGLDSNDWVVAMIGGFSSDGQVIDAEVEERRVLEAWPTAIAQTRGLVAGFIKARPELLDKRPDKKSKHASRAFPTPRTVEYATYALASSMVHGLDESETDLFVSGFVGDGWFGEFATYRKHVDLPDIADLLDKKISWKHDPRRLDRTMAVLSAGAALISPAAATNRKERAKAFWEILGSVSDDAADVVVPAARAMRLAQPPLITKEFGATGPLSKLHPLMKAIGLVS